ncbi:MAG: hypothetical protein KKG02_05830 [Candidatus Edwardsbacteria bacterium]|nr:hypothetical protein [Candidatus Edwardsbacteria bacterium]MBU2594049.1 hypothetical protein [Candidatus Edwardsbacteria bacterium]
MRKSFAILAAVVMLLGVANVTFATQSRVVSLGKAWMYDGDFEDIYFYPNLTASYPRMIVAELGTYPAGFSYNGSAAITFANEEQTWGVAGLDINHKITNEDEFNTLITTAFGMNPVDNKWHLFYARDLGGLSAGLHIARAAYAETFTNSDTVSGSLHQDNSTSAGIWDFNFGLGYSPMENMEANLGFSFKTYSFSDEINWTWPGATPAVTPYSETLESDGGSGIDVALRVLYGMSDNFKLVPTAGLSMSSIGYKLSSTDTLFLGVYPEGGEMSTFDFWAGFGANYTPVENVRVIGGLDFGISSTTIEDTTGVLGIGVAEEKYSTFLFPGFSAAVEADVLKWLTLRIGASKDIAKTTETTTTSANTVIEDTYTSAAYHFGFGLGFKFNKLCIDVKLNDESPYELGYLMSGAVNAPFTQVSATYKF